MTKDAKRGVGGTRKPPLTREDQELWRYVTRNVVPIEPANRTTPSSAKTSDEQARPTKSVEAKTKPAPRQKQVVLQKKDIANPTAAVSKAASAFPPRTSNQTAPIDRRKARRLSSGRLEIEARIDLHGMRQSEAHRALRAFINRCHANGKRHVLIITGKGRRTYSNEYDTHTEPGILRRNVPRWLAEPDLSSFVVEWTTASPRHGGEGALYVTLRIARQPAR